MGRRGSSLVKVGPSTPSLERMGSSLGELSTAWKRHPQNQPASSLASAPMMTIPSESDGSAPGHESTAMLRRNSLPVLTLRELDALKEKDGELGIERGGGWAWVRRGSEE
jgi:hypothetical protein